MPVTRSSRLLCSTPSGAPSLAPVQLLTPEQDASPSSLPFKATRRTPAALKNPSLSLPPTPLTPSSVLPVAPPAAVEADQGGAAAVLSNTSTLVPPVLSFSFEEAKAHLVAADPRFAVLFATYKVTPYENLQTVDVWRSLVSSLLGQQISWLAARSIKHKFIRLIFPTLLPEKHDPETAASYAHLFPSPAQILALAGDKIVALKGAGLSTRKAEYVLALAEKFVDGSLSADKLMRATDEGVRELLIACRGIGPWTVDMFQMFSLHRPNILPCGDLGVQKGLLKWTLQAHDPRTPHHLVPPAPVTPHSVPSNPGASSFPPAFGLSTPSSPSTSTALLPPLAASPPPPTSAPVAPAEPYGPRPLPEGITLELLKSRLAGKKAKGGAYLTPAEMDALTASWAPYRSVGVWLMWKVCEGE